MSRQLMIDDLQRSGLTQVDATKLKVKYLTPAATLKSYKKKYPSYEIPYFDVNGKVKNFARVRFLAEVINKVTGKVQKYTQPKSTSIHLYFPPNLLIPDEEHGKNIRWSDVAKNTDIPIIITEGEKKAAKLCAEGMACIGLGGVWSFQSKARGQKLISDFDVINWNGREVHIIFDSDFVDNMDVVRASNALAKRLTDEGASVWSGCMPAINNEKTGIDDYLLTHSLNNFINNVLSTTEPYTRGIELMKMNSRVCLIEKLSSYYLIEQKTLVNRDTLINVVYPEHTYMSEDGEIGTAKEWCKWVNRRKHKSLVYKPNEPTITSNNELNLWEGYAHTPVEGDIKPWQELIDYVFKDDEKFKHWFLQWLAYPIQYPATKLYTAVLLWSRSHGTGKSFIGYIVGEIYGVNFCEISQDDLQGDFNSWSVNKQFILGEEITGSDKRSHADKIKGMITRKQIRVKEKFKPEYFIDDCINYLFTSNHHNALYIEESDRRYAVHEVTGEPMPIEFYERVDHWFKQGGAAYLMYHLMYEINVADFKPHAPAPFTSGKDIMLQASASELDLWCRELRDNPDETLIQDNMQIDRDLYTSEELYELFIYQCGYDHGKVSVQAFRNSLSKAGFRSLSPIKCDGKTRRLIPVRNIKHWTIEALNSERKDNYTKSVLHKKDKPKRYAKNNVVKFNKDKKE